MRVVHVVRQFLPSVGGLEVSVLNLCLQQRALGCDARVLTLNRLFNAPQKQLPERETLEGIPVVRIPFRGSSRYPVAPTVLQHLNRADLIHVHAIDFFYDYIGWTRPIHRKPLVSTTHGGFFHTDFAAALKRVYFQTMTRATSVFYDRIIACSDSDCERFRRVASRVIVIENGAAIDRFANKSSPVRSRTIVSFGRLTVHKQIETLFPILRTLRSRGQDWRLVIAGEEFDVTVQTLRGAAERCGVGEFVRFHIAPSNQELIAAIGKATYFASPSAFEGFGITAIEAIAAGLIPILSAIPPFAKLIGRVGAGTLIDPWRADEAANAIIELDTRIVDLAAAKSRLMEAARAYDWSRVAQEYLDQYDDIVRRN